ncbi:hypothetical protein GCM10018793_21920 [Streptomyces sulfonofaciens]|uniref:Uncharacterized protein n=1 Tax=Streptomyces sulfonofaciens TaxID=68272 RepID=A0A919KYJ6_9ACTN|nr:hypothetical protein [Streptomyces sulfonofaciens]GHH76376.1 hypothetical protein GCM10018793_21920 [Streptomyces sulfonofaciens]
MGEILVNTTTAGLQYQPAVDSTSSTDYMAVWTDRSTADIKGRVLTADGGSGGEEFTVNTPTPGEGNTNRQWPTVADTGFSVVTAWIEEPFGVPPPRPQVKMQRFRHSTRTGPEIQVNTTDIDPSNRPTVTRMVDGGTVVVWTDSRPDRRIRAQRFDAEGNKAEAEFTVNATEGFHSSPAVSILADGSYLVAWTTDPSAIGGGRLTFRFFAFDGTPRSGEIQPNVSGFQGANSVTLLDNGRFVVAHVDRIADSDLGVPQSTVEASIFEADGTEATSLTAGSPQGFNRSWPALAPLPGGRFLFAWVEKSATTFATVPTLMAKVCSDTQGSLADKVQVNTASTGDRFQVSAATAFGDGIETAFICWADDNRAAGDPSEFAVRGRAFRIVPPGNLV